jgi:hypothetical protein
MTPAVRLRHFRIRTLKAFSVWFLLYRLYKYLLYQSRVFFENLLPHITVWPYITWRYRSSHLSCPPCWYHGLQEIRRCEHWVASNGTKSIQNLIKISPTVLKTDRYVQPRNDFSCHYRPDPRKCESLGAEAAVFSVRTITKTADTRNHTKLLAKLYTNENSRIP